MKWFIQIVYSYDQHKSVVGFWKDELTASGQVDWDKSKFATSYGEATLFEEKQVADDRRKGIYREVFRQNCSGDLMVCCFDAEWGPHQLFPEGASIFEMLQLPRKLKE